MLNFTSKSTNKIDKQNVNIIPEAICWFTNAWRAASCSGLDIGPGKNVPLGFTTP